MGKQKLNEFEPVSIDQWKTVVERDLKGADFGRRLVKKVAGGIAVQPLYDGSGVDADQAGMPGAAPFTRGNDSLGRVEMGWDVRQQHRHPDPAVAADQIQEDLMGGATSVALRFDDAMQSGTGERGQGGIACSDLQSLDALLAHVPLDRTPIGLLAGASTLPVAAGLAALAQKRQVPLKALSGCLGFDPLGTLATHGELPGSLDNAWDQMAALARWCGEHAPGMRAVQVDGVVYHDAGADAAQELGMVLATVVSYLHAMTERGLSVSQAAQQITLRLSVGRDFFVELAKLRAARALWCKVIQASGGDEQAQAARIHAETSTRTKTERDPWVNLLRGTAESFAAAAAGADSIGTGPFDTAIGQSDALSRRMARNTQLLLREESNLHRVVDPAGGSWYVETLTDQLARKAWSQLQSLEQSGGAAQAVADGSFAEALEQAAEADEKAVALRKLPITGVSEFPHVREEAVKRAAPSVPSSAEEAQASLSSEPGQWLAQATQALGNGSSLLSLTRAVSQGGATHARPLEPRPYAAAFEQLRDRCDAHQQRTGARPRVFLANLGPIPEHKGRAMFTQNFVEAAGFEALTNDGFADAAAAAEAYENSGATIAVLCSSDKVYGELAQPAATAIRDRGAKAIVLAGKPGDAEADYRAAGVTDFIFMGSNLVTTLTGLLQRAEVQ